MALLSSTERLIDGGIDAPLLSQLEDGIKQQIETVGKLSAFASQYPYYK